MQGPKNTVMPRGNSGRQKEKAERKRGCRCRSIREVGKVQRIKKDKTIAGDTVYQYTDIRYPLQLCQVRLVFNSFRRWENSAMAVYSTSVDELIAVSQES